MWSGSADARLLALLNDDEFNRELVMTDEGDLPPTPPDLGGAFRPVAAGGSPFPARAVDQDAEFRGIYDQWQLDANAPSPGLFSAPSLEPLGPQQGPQQGGQGQGAGTSTSLSAGAGSSFSSRTATLVSLEGPSRASSEHTTTTTTTTTTTSGSCALQPGQSGASSFFGSSASASSAAHVMRCSTTGMSNCGTGISEDAANDILASAAILVQPALARVGAQVGQQTTTASGWQALLQKKEEAEAPVVPPQPAGPKRGRKPTYMVNGVAIAKPVKDKKRENSILIKQLEAELAAKLTLVKGLEGENSELKRKERVLQMSVDTSEHNISRMADPGLDRNLEPMLKSFRSAYNRSTAERVLAKVANLKNGQNMTFELFVSCWQAIVMEMCDGLVADTTASTPEDKAEVQAHLQALQDQLIDFIMAVCATDLSIIRQAKSRNLCTGEEAESYKFWENVVDKLALTQDQILDLIGAFDMFSRLFQRNVEERRELKQDLAQAIAADQGGTDFGSSGVVAAKMALVDASEKLARNVRHCGVLHGMLSFISMRMLNCRQAAQLCMHSAPYFPSVVHMQVVIRRTAERLGIMAPVPMTQTLLATRFAHPHGPGNEAPQPPSSTGPLPRLAPQAVCT